MDLYADVKSTKKLSYIVNSALLVFVIVMFGLYYRYHVTWMVWHSIPTMLIYLINFGLIYAGWLEIFVWVIYGLLVAYMSAGTICLGYNYGFHLYSMSIIPILFYIEYIAYRIKTKSPRAMLISIGIVIVYLVSCVYTVVRGPIYMINDTIAGVFLVINAGSVFAFLITYTNILIKMVVSTQQELTRIAMKDHLTGLYNRHFMMAHLNELEKVSMDKETLRWIAILDIDDFKKINDRYGHNCGDVVLKHIGTVMTRICGQSNVARWGGEEFLVYGEDDSCLERLRLEIASHPVEYQGKYIAVTVTIGAALSGEYHIEGLESDTKQIEAWIEEADTHLYYGKNHGKNQVVWNI